MLHSKTILGTLFLFILAILTGACTSNAKRTSRMYEQSIIPSFWKNTLTDIRETVADVKRGKTEIIARSPGGRPVYLVSYGDPPEIPRQANYHSATGARNPGYYAKKTETTPQIVYIVGPPHGHEIENIVGTLNLIRVAETGADWRGQKWPRLAQNISRCRLLIVPGSNPDGRARCPYDSFIGVPSKEMTRIGQGTRKDGSLYGWPGVKAVHPMRGDIGFLGAYFNEAGINQMHDEFFEPMANETKALLRVARREAPDYIINLHSHEHPPAILSTDYVPWYCKEIEAQFAERLMARYREAGLPAGPVPKPSIDGEKYPPPSFNLTSALHHVCGGVSMLFECCHGLKGDMDFQVTHEQILDIQMMLFDELLQFAVEAPRPQERLKE